MESNSEAPQSERILRGGQIVERVLLSGAVKFFDDGRGWGYIERDDGELSGLPATQATDGGQGPIP